MIVLSARILLQSTFKRKSIVVAKEELRDQHTNDSNGRKNHNLVTKIPQIATYVKEPVIGQVNAVKSPKEILGMLFIGSTSFVACNAKSTLLHGVRICYIANI